MCVPEVLSRTQKPETEENKCPFHFGRFLRRSDCQDCIVQGPPRKRVIFKMSITRRDLNRFYWRQNRVYYMTNYHYFLKSITYDTLPVTTETQFQSSLRTTWADVYHGTRFISFSISPLKRYNAHDLSACDLRCSPREKLNQTSANRESRWDLKTSAETRPSPCLCRDPIALKPYVFRSDPSAAKKIAVSPNRHFDAVITINCDSSNLFENAFPQLCTTQYRLRFFSGDRIEGKLYFSEQIQYYRYICPPRNRITIGNIARNGIETVFGSRVIQGTSRKLVPFGDKNT